MHASIIESSEQRKLRSRGRVNHLLSTLTPPSSAAAETDNTQEAVISSAIMRTARVLRDGRDLQANEARERRETLSQSGSGICNSAAP